jgi:hypothetical protein
MLCSHMVQSMKKIFKKNKVEFWCSVPGMSKIEEIVPKKMNKIAPCWWNDVSFGDKTIKDCPSFPEIFSNSYILPMWCDTKIYNKNNEIFWETPTDIFQWDFHSNNQFLDFSPHHIKNNFSIILKARCPWFLKTPPGYSVYQMPAFWHFNENFSVAPGIIDTDFYHQINQQVFISLRDGEELFIRRGQPFAMYFPFKREKTFLEVREKNKNDRLDEHKSFLIFSTKFSGGYKKIQKNI